MPSGLGPVRLARSEHLGCDESRRGRPCAGAVASFRPVPRRPASYFLVDGFDVRAEAARLCALPALGGPDGRMATTPPELTIRRASRRPRRTQGFAVPAQHRVSVTVYPGIRRGDLLETLLHELVHLAVGESPESRRWHGRQFRETLAAAMAQAYGVRVQGAAASRHGAYAEAIQRRIETLRAAAA